MAEVSRRSFMATAGIAAAVPSIAMTPTPLLSPGDKVAAVAPAGPLEPDFLSALLENLRHLGLEPVLGPHAAGKHRFFSGTDEERAGDLNEAIRNPEVKAISCLRGGWGCARILPLIDWAAWRKSPKPVIGFSDITALLVSASGHKIPVGFHGSQAPPPEKPMSSGSWRKALMETGPYDLLTSGGSTDTLTVANPSEERVTGRLIGGNLMVLNQLIGTGYLPSCRDKILFLEDVNEAPYRIDRMLTQMKLAGIFRGVRAILIGQFTKCDDPDNPDVPKALDVLHTHFDALGVPVVGNLPVGHAREQIILPVGAQVELRTQSTPELWWLRR